MSYIFEYQYFGNINYYFELINAKHYGFDEYDQYEKMSFRNRCRILGSNGPIELSIPVIGGRGIKLPMSEVKICYKEDWRSRHFKTLVSCYNRSPWFENYRLFFEELYSNKFEYLLGWDKKCHDLTLRLLKFSDMKNVNTSGGIRRADSLDPDNRFERKNKFLPRHPNPYNISIKQYPQVFTDRFGFVPDLSILDLIFCEGPNALEILKSSDRPT